MTACTQYWARHGGAAIEWTWRTLEAFGDQRLADVADRYDLLVIDHPLCGTAAESGLLAALDELLPAHVLGQLETDSVGPSHASYRYAGQQWALAVDAACQVTAVRDDLLGDMPIATWADIMEIARARQGAVAVPLSPAHAMCSWLTLVANGRGWDDTGELLADDETCVGAIEFLSEIAALGPAEALGWEPPDVLAHLTRTDRLVCVPLTFGYVTYARAGSARRPCRFTDIPSAGYGPVGAVLGGAGLAVSATSKHASEAGLFAAFAAGSESQCGLVAPAGGQPSSRTAWSDPAIDADARGFYSGTRATIESAWVRPRDPWWPPFQLEGGRLLNAALARSAPAAATFGALTGLYRELRRAR
jgi:multiple sugar transport system substrate-binding protein